MDKKKVGFVALVGRPNSGKSTFINTVIDEKVSIVSPTPQTTQKSIRGIYTTDDMQIIFQDTPGIHKTEKKWNQDINAVAKKQLKDADVVVRFIDGSRDYGEEEEHLDAIVSHSDKPLITVYTKADDMTVMNVIAADKYLKISSVTGEGIETLLSQIAELLPLGPELYPEEYYTDQDVYTRISEIIREKIFLNFTQEVPHSCFVQVEEVTDMEKLKKIQAIIYTETESQKGIIVGKKGAMIQKIGTDARIDLEKIFDTKIFLGLRVKVMSKWRKKANITKNILR